MSMTDMPGVPRDWRLVLVSASVGAAIAGLSLYFCLTKPRYSFDTEMIGIISNFT